MKPRKRHTMFSHHPEVLYSASIERIAEADALFQQGAWAYSMFTAGLAVESLLQAFSLRKLSPHDARHDLRLWLARCPDAVIDSIMRSAAMEWSYLIAAWDNSLRYLSRSGLLGYLRSRGLTSGIKLGRSGADTIVRVNAHRLLNAAPTVHSKGMLAWPSD